MCKNLFGEKLRKVRLSNGLTQAQLADKLGISASTVGMYEQGRREPDNNMLSKICKTLNVSTNYLLGFEDNDIYSKKEVDDIINEFISILEKRQGLMFDGQPITDSVRDKIVTAIKVASSVAFSCSKDENSIKEGK